MDKSKKKKSIIFIHEIAVAHAQFMYIKNDFLCPVMAIVAFVVYALEKCPNDVNVAQHDCNLNMRKASGSE